MDALRNALKAEYRDGMGMLRDAITACPEHLWTSGVPPRSFWRIAYHCLFFTHLYLEQEMNDFQAWEHHRDEVESDQERERMDAAPYTKAELLEYWQLVDERIAPQIDRLDLTASESGFPWYTIPKLDHVLLNLRHLQEHTGQLRDRLLEAGIDQRWSTRRELQD